MAAGKCLVDVAERRLRAIYEALDNLNYKQAIKLVDNILKKNKDFSCAKALKCIALVRSGRPNEALDILDEIKTFDASTLQAMTVCYKETENPEKIIGIYDCAVKQEPKNEEYLSHLFMACVRAQDYPKQQKASMNLFKCFPKNPYYFWAVMTYVMQAESSDDEKKKSMFLTLAERMIMRFIKEEKLQAEEEVRLYMIVLEAQGKYEQLLELLHNNLGEKLKSIPLERCEKELEYLMKLDRWSDINSRCKQFLRENPDQWSFFRNYISSFVNLTEMECPTANGEQSLLLEELKCELSSLASKNKSLRGPFLAQLELFKQLPKRHGTEGSLLDALLNYFNFFGNKACCFSDMRQYTELLEGSDREKFLSMCKDVADVPNTDTNKQLIREVCVECFARQLGFHNTLSNDMKLNQAMCHVRRYKEIVQLEQGISLSQHGEILILLAAHLLVDIYNRTGDVDMVWQAIVFVEDAVTRNPTNAQLKLVLIFLYATLGAYGLCDEIFSQIEVKYIMLDSLGYLFSSFAYTSAQFQATNRLYAASIAFLNSSQKEISEQIIVSFKYGSFNQALDMVKLKHRIKYSFQFTLVQVESIFLDIMQRVVSLSEARETLKCADQILESLSIAEETSDNRDFDAVMNFDPLSSKFTRDQQTLSFETNVVWLRMRYYLLRSLASCMLQRNTMKHLEEFEQLTERASNYEKELDWRDIHRPPPCQMHFYTKYRYDKVALLLIKPFFDFHKQEHFAYLQESVAEALRILDENFCTLTTTMFHNDSFNGGCLQQMVYFIETCTIAAIAMLRVKESIGSKKRKRSCTLDMGGLLDNFSTVVAAHLKSLLVNLQKSPLNVKIGLPGAEKVCASVQASYTQSVLEVLQILEGKIKFVNSLRSRN